MNLVNRIKSLFPGKPMLSKSDHWFVSISDFLSGFGTKRVNDTQILSEGYISNADFYSVLRKITEAVRTLVIKTEIINNRNNIITNEGWEYDLLSKPNDKESFKDLTEQAVTNLGATGDCYIRMIGPSLGVKPSELYVMRSVDVEPQLDADNNIEYYTFNSGSGDLKRVEKEDVIHVKLYDPSTRGSAYKKGLSPGQPGYNILDASNELAIADAHILKNKGAAGLLTGDTPKGSGGSAPGNHKLTEGEATTIKERLKKLLGGASNKGDIVVTGTPLKYVQIGVSPSDLKIQESYIVKIRQMCNILNLDSSLFNDPANKRFNNQKEADKYLYKNAAIPMLERVIEGIEREFQKYNNRFSVSVDASRIEALQTDKLQEAEKDTKISTGIQNILTQYNAEQMSREQAEYLLVDVWEVPEEKVNMLLR